MTHREGETGLLRSAQEQATAWGAERFATEYRRRELEERWLEAARSNTTPYTPADRTPDVLSGPVDAAVQEAVVGSDARLGLLRPSHQRHASVPRPPAPEPAGRRTRRRRHTAETHTPSAISPSEAARMSPAARRLYGLDDPG